MFNVSIDYLIKNNISQQKGYIQLQKQICTISEYLSTNDDHIEKYIHRILSELLKQLSLFLIDAQIANKYN